MVDRAQIKQTLDALFSAAVADGTLHSVAAVVCNRAGNLYSAGFGADATVSSDSTGAIMSMTKAVTGAAAMQLVEQGRLSLDEPAGQVCPYLAEVQVLDGFSDSGEPLLRAPSQPVTLRHLLAHTSGFVYDMWNGMFGQYLQATGTPSIASLQKAALRVPLMFDPGSRWEYGIGIDWVGQMVEAVSGQTLGAYCTEHIFTPLGMHDTAFVPTVAMAERMLPMCHRLEDGSLHATPAQTSPPPAAPVGEFEMGGGGLTSTASDYARFIRMLLNRGELEGQRILAAATVEVMGQSHTGPLRVTELKTVIPQASADAELFPGEEKTWGLTFQRHEQPGFTGRSAGTLMWAGLTNCYYWLDHQRDIGGLFFTQVLPFADPKCLEVYYAFEREVYSALDA